MLENISFKKVLDWFDSYYDDVIETKKRIRGKIFCGCRIEIHGVKHICIVHELGVDGESKDERETSFVKNIVYDDRQLIIEWTTEDFVKVVEGEKNILESDYFWSDEE